MLPETNVKNTSEARVTAVQGAIGKIYMAFDLPQPSFSPVATLDLMDTAYDYKVEAYRHYSIHGDHLGSSSYITDPTSVACQHMEYLPFGETLVDEHLNSINSPFKYNGKEYDAETGNYYYGARYYDPKWSVWTSVDPLAEKFAGRSSYEYCFGNPVKFIDPTGMGADDIIIDGSIKSSFLLSNAFDTFARTKEGIAFLKDYAKKGDVIAGHTYTENGKYHDKGLDVTFRGADLGEFERGNTDASTKGNRSNIDITINNNSSVYSQDKKYYNMDEINNPFSKNTIDNGVKAILSRTISIFHETFIHGDMFAKDFMDDGLFNNSNIDEALKQKGPVEHWQHLQIQAGSDRGSSRFQTIGLDGVKSANSMWSSGKHYNDSQLGEMIWHFTGSLKSN